MADENRVDLENPEAQVDEIVENLDKMHASLVSAANLVGHLKEEITETRPIWTELRDSSQSNPDVAQLYASGVNVIHAVNSEIQNQAQQIDFLPTIIHQIAGTASFYLVTAVTTSSATGVFHPGTFKFRTILHNPDRHAEYVARFKSYDAALGNTFNSILEALYGTRADGERAALFQGRQAFDHLLQRLAPDDEVRNSIYFNRKAGDKPDQVQRDERIRFALNHHVADLEKRKTLEAAEKHMLDTYQVLNRAHTRGEIDSETARDAVYEMLTILESWADAVGI